MKADFNKLLKEIYKNSITTCLNDKDYSLAMSKEHWKNKFKQYRFTEEELEIAEKREDKFIGKKMGVSCYISTWL